MSQVAAVITSDTLDDEIPEDDAVCSVCGFADLGENNPIVMCDACQVCVHTRCYAISDEALQKEKWFCLPCSKGVLQRNPDGTPNLNRRCIACSHLGGAFSQTTDQRWVHTSCAMHLPGVSISLEGVTLPRLDPGQATPECVLCKKKFGLTRKCSFLDCHNHMHIHCMTRHDCLIDGFTHPTHKDEVVEAVFCPTHSKVAETSYDQLCTIIHYGKIAICTTEQRDALEKAKKTKKEKPDEGSSSDAPITITTTRSGRDVKRPFDSAQILLDKAAIDAIKDSITEDHYPSSESDSDPEPHKRHRRRSTRQHEDGTPASPQKEGAAQETPAAAPNQPGGLPEPAPKRRGRKSLAQKEAEAKAKAAAALVQQQTPVPPVGQMPLPAGVPPTSHLGQPAPMLLQHQMPQHVPMGLITGGPAPNPYPVPFNIPPSLPPSVQPQLASGIQNQAVLAAHAAVQAQNPPTNPQ